MPGKGERGTEKCKREEVGREETEKGRRGREGKERGGKNIEKEIPGSQQIQKSKLIKELTVRPKTMMLLDENRGDAWDTESDTDFLVRTSKAQVTKAGGRPWFFPTKVNKQLE